MSFILSLLVFLTCLQSGWGQCNGTTLVIQLELCTKVYIQSPGFQAGKYPQNLSCAWRFDCSRNTSEIIYTFHHKGMGTTQDRISLYGGVNDTGIKLIDTTENLSQDSTTRLVVDYSSLFLLFTTDNVESNDGYGVEMYILESQDYSGTDCSTTKHIQPKSTTQYLTSPNFPQKYPTSKICEWNITTADEVVVKVIFMDVEPDTSTTCYDYVTIGNSKELCADWEYNIDTTYVFNDSFLITFKSDNMVAKQGFVLSYVESKDNTTEEQTSIKPEVETTTNIELSTTQQSTSNTESTTDELPTSQYSTSNTETTTDKLSPSQYSTPIAQTSTAETETLSTPLPDSTTNIPPGWGQSNGRTLVIQLELFTKVYIQSPGFQEGKYPRNLSCAWRFDRSRNTSEIIYTLHQKGMVTTTDIISLYGGVNDTGIELINTTDNVSNDSTTRNVVDYSSLFLLFTTDDVESNDGDGFEMYILESQDYSGTDCSTTKQIQPKSTTQYLTSPNFPQEYPLSTTCAWNITTTDEVVVKVIFMDVEPNTHTCSDYVTIGDSKLLCADWEYNIDTTYVFNGSFLITFKSGNQVPEQGFVLSYVESKDNTTEEQTSIKPEVETTINIELSTTQQSTSNTESTTYELSTSAYSTSTAQTSTSEAEALSTEPSTLSSITSTESTLVTTTHQQTSTDQQTTTYPATDVQSDRSTDITTTGVASSSDTISLSITSTIHSTHAMETTTYTSSSEIPSTGASSPSEASTKYKTTDTIETTETPMVDSTTTIQQEEETLSPEALGVMNAAPIVTGVIGIGVLIGIVYLIRRRRRSTSGKSPKYANDSRETNDTQPTEISVPPRWIQMIQMIDTMNKNNYNPTFVAHESH